MAIISIELKKKVVNSKLIKFILIFFTGIAFFYFPYGALSNIFVQQNEVILASIIVSSLISGLSAVILYD